MTASEFLNLFNSIHNSDFKTDKEFLSVLKNQVKPNSYVNKYVRGVFFGIVFNLIACAFLIYCMSANRISPSFFPLFRIISMIIFCISYYKYLVTEEEKHEDNTYYKSGEHYETTYKDGVATTKVVEDGEWEDNSFPLWVLILGDFFIHEILLIIVFLKVVIGTLSRLLKCLPDKELDKYYILGMFKTKVDQDFAKDYKKTTQTYRLKPNELYNKALQIKLQKENENKSLQRKNELLKQKAEKYKQTTPKKYEEILSHLAEPQSETVFDFNGTRFLLDLTQSYVRLQDTRTETWQSIDLYSCDYYKSWIIQQN